MAYRAGLDPIPPRFSPWILRAVQGLLPLLCWFRCFPWLPAGLRGFELVEGERLLEAWRAFGRGELRLILAFRHGEVDDPLAGLWLLSRGLPRLARRLGQPPPPRLHVHFLYDRGMTLWGGAALGWVLSRLGGVSLRRGRRPDWTALRQSRRLVLEGRFPFAVAPEGATNGHGERIGPLEPGVAQLGLWCVHDLLRQGRPQGVWIVPIGLQYHYPTAPWGRLERLLARLERQAGLAPPALPATGSGVDPGVALYPRLLALGERLLQRLEAFYGALGGAPSFAPPAAEGPLGERIAALLDRALAAAEVRFGLPAAGTPVDRCRRLEEEAWQRLHRSDLPHRRRLCPLDRALADWLAREAALVLPHLRLAEGFVAVSGDYVARRPSFERFAETLLLLEEALQKLAGVRRVRRSWLGPRRVRITVAPPLPLRHGGAPEPTALARGPGAQARLTEAIGQALHGTLV
ncbi:MAG: 1-acyl-sn-glycerol-3-phosphate acyltransferase [Synechococcus sp.]|nr:1-acyl-sn-glycerol-3-phosphate acyltransferase [Synechococcus sp.]